VNTNLILIDYVFAAIFTMFIGESLTSMPDRKAPIRHRSAAQRVEPGLKRRAGASTIGRLSAAYTTALAGEVLHRTSLDFLDLLITMTVSSAGVRHLLNPLPLRRAVAGKNGAARDGITRGISRNAISRALNVPLETVRRRVAVLLEKKVIQERFDGLSVPEASPLGEIAQGRELLALNAKILRQLFRNLKSAGVRLE
jgi:hypothetical protein